MRTYNIYLSPEDGKQIREQYGEGRIFVEHYETEMKLYSEEAWLRGEDVAC